MRLSTSQKNPGDRFFLEVRDEPKRWVVERTFAWLGRCRRLSKDYELIANTSLNMVYLGMIKIMTIPDSISEIAVSDSAKIFLCDIFVQKIGEVR